MTTKPESASKWVADCMELVEEACEAAELTLTNRSLRAMNSVRDEIVKQDALMAQLAGAIEDLALIVNHLAADACPDSLARAKAALTAYEESK